ncbi:hypothetical protein EON64_04025 [archaeon]|nr:MAG: hypothetical protein EON64_04025 [archaeon]
MYPLDYLNPLSSPPPSTLSRLFRWFVWGSVGVVITSSVMIHNKYSPLFNDDDSILTPAAFIFSWVLMLLSGLFSTLGSLFFVRAFHENPPMRPMFRSYYHLQSDELVASWLFFLATVPFVPYSLIFLAAEGYHSLMYIVALLFAIAASMCSLLFVRACYPSDRTHQDLLLPLFRSLCCCLSPQSLEHYFLNDWLGGSWLFFWACAVATLCTLALYAVSVEQRNPLQEFMFGTSLIESALFVLGSAYFVAGSYPEEERAQEARASGLAAQEVRSGPVESGVQESGDRGGDNMSDASESSRKSPRLFWNSEPQYHFFKETGESKV